VELVVVLEVHAKDLNSRKHGGSGGGDRDGGGGGGGGGSDSNGGGKARIFALSCC
jgi:hypothetical protein